MIAEAPNQRAMIAATRPLQVTGSADGIGILGKLNEVLLGKVDAFTQESGPAREDIVHVTGSFVLNDALGAGIERDVLETGDGVFVGGAVSDLLCDADGEDVYLDFVVGGISDVSVHEGGG
ncbi:uncharacterized protein N7473_008716 [Penicillium subrubescens]|uniref:uncharacterized protein n=1 Tax=Penicillium subrubescens TaxID=1316194 RepID=UPI0025452E21|nr:uncharacterized protein N7473_008716 [Penicillium subrubescens]KAJ5886042.1 hypothetical protein N7473_008716 [Penicillium subrubescens]